jgi:hypothetical protein
MMFTLIDTYYENGIKQVLLNITLKRRFLILLPSTMCVNG